MPEPLKRASLHTNRSRLAPLFYDRPLGGPTNTHDDVDGFHELPAITILRPGNTLIWAQRRIATPTLGYWTQRSAATT